MEGGGGCSNMLDYQGYQRGSITFQEATKKIQFLDNEA